MQAHLICKVRASASALLILSVLCLLPLAAEQGSGERTPTLLAEVDVEQIPEKLTDAQAQLFQELNSLTLANSGASCELEGDPCNGCTTRCDSCSDEGRECSPEACCDCCAAEQTTAGALGLGYVGYGARGGSFHGAFGVSGAVSELPPPSTPVPEPSTYLVLAGFVALIVILRRRKERAKSYKG